MNRKIAHQLTRLYPRWWRDRYGEEFLVHLESGPATIRIFADVCCNALYQRISPTHGGSMEQPTLSFRNIVRQPDALLPIGMSLIATAMVLSFLAVHGVVHEKDEGAEAHIWQILMAGQLPIILFFAIKWLPRAPRQAILILALQAGAALASIAPVFFLNL
jgi:hypothetical protein